jgi:hypothetical protein
VAADRFAKYTHDTTINMHIFEVNFCVSDELFKRLKLFQPHREVLSNWDRATFFAQLSTLTALAKAACDWRRAS